MTDPVARPAPAWHLLREPQFRRYWSAAAVSFVGDQVSLLALPLLAVLMLGATPAQMGYLTAAGLAPNLALAVAAGVWVDRMRFRRHAMVAADIARCLLVASIPLAYAFHALDMTQLYVVAFLVGVGGVFYEVANGTLFVSLVRAEQYVPANSLMNGARALSFVAGPSIAGVLVQVLSAPVALITDALSYAASAVLLGRTRAVEPEPDVSRQGQFSAGFRFLRSDRALSSLLVAVATLNLFNYMFSALLILYVTVHLGISPGVLGVLVGAAAVGALLGSVVTGRLSRAVGVGPAYVIGMVVFPLPLLLVPAAHGPRPVVLLMVFLAEALSGVGVMVLDIAAGSLMAALIPHRLRARVAGMFRTVNFGIRPVGALIGGALGTAIGVHPTLWVSGIGASLAVLLLIGSPVVRMRDLPETPPEHSPAEPSPAEPGHSAQAVTSAPAANSAEAGATNSAEAEHEHSSMAEPAQEAAPTSTAEHPSGPRRAPVPVPTPEPTPDQPAAPPGQRRPTHDDPSPPHADPTPRLP